MSKYPNQLSLLFANRHRHSMCCAEMRRIGIACVGCRCAISMDAGDCLLRDVGEGQSGARIA